MPAKPGPWLSRLSHGPHLVAIVLLLVSLREHSATAARLGQDPPARSQKRALLIGIDKYKHAGPQSGLKNLKGAVNDVESMKALLVGKFEFPDDPAHLQILKDDQATRAAIVQAIEQHLIVPSGERDVIVLYFAGHGSQRRNEGRLNGFDETIVPHDSRDPARTVFDITGDEISALVDRLSARTPNVTVILDSCQSGTLVQPTAFSTRSAREGYLRLAPPDTRQPPPAPSAAARPAAPRGAGLRPNSSTWTFLAAARAEEFAKEYDDGGIRQGAFTSILVKALRNAPAGTTYRDIMDVVRGRVTELFADQHPQLEGAGGDAFVFGDGQSLADLYIPVKPTPDGGQLAAGITLGVTKDSVFEVFPAGTKQFPVDKGVAKLRVTSVEPFTAPAMLLSGVSIPPDSRAVEREHVYDTPQVRLAIGTVNAPVPAIRQALSRRRQVALIDIADATPADLTLGIVNGSLELRGLSEPVALFTAPANASSVQPTVDAILSWAQWLNLRNLSNPSSPLKVRLDAAFSDPAASPSAIKDGSTVTLTLRNQSFDDLYVSVVDFSTDGSRTVLYPPPGQQPRLQAAQDVTLRPRRVWVPAGRTSVTDTVKLFATEDFVDFRGLTAGPIPTALTSRGALDDLFFAAAGAERNVRAVGLGRWATAERVFTVTR